MAKRKIGWLYFIILCSLLWCVVLLQQVNASKADFEINGTTLVSYHGTSQEVVVPEGVIDIAEDAFCQNFNFTSLVLPGSVKHIENNAFRSCHELTDVYFQGSQDRWQKVKIGLYNTYLTRANRHYNTFSDVSADAWYYKAVQYMYDHKYMSGTSATTFRPEMKLTRGMMAIILWNMADRPEVSGSISYPDVKRGAANYKAILWATKNKIVSGYSDGTFGPNDEITRAQVAVMLWKYAKLQNLPSTGEADLSKFQDAAAVPSYAKEAMRWAVYYKIISGKSGGTLLDPRGTAKRKEIASMVHTFCKKFMPTEGPVNGIMTQSGVQPKGSPSYRSMQGDGYVLYYKMNDARDGVVIVGCTTYRPDIVIDLDYYVNQKGEKVSIFEEKCGYRVTEIGPGAFKNQKNIREVRLPDDVKIIGEEAFKGCSNMEVCSLYTEGETPIKLNNACFEDCSSLKDMNGVQNQWIEFCGEHIFDHCDQLSIQNAGYTVYLKTGYNLPASQSIIVSGEFPEDCSIFVAEQHHPDDFEEGYVLAYRYNNELQGNEIIGCITTHEEVYVKIKKIAKIIGDNLVAIGAHAFEGQTNIYRVKLPDTIKTIKKEAFLDCTDIRQVDMDTTRVIPELEAKCFGNCESLLGITGMYMVAGIGDHAFTGCTELHTNQSPNDRVYINAGDDLYRGSFAGNYPYNCPVFGDDGYNLYYQIDPELKGVVILGSTFFRQDIRIDLVYVSKRLGQPIVGIGDYAFANQINLKALRVTPELKRIGVSAFQNCRNLQDFVYMDPLKYPMAIEEYAFLNCEKLRNCLESSSTQPSSISAVYVGKQAYANCRSLKSVEMNVERIEDGAFKKCENLSSVKLPLTTYIGASAFEGDANLEKAELCCGALEIIGDRAFYQCTSLQKLNALTDDNMNHFFTAENKTMKIGFQAFAYTSLGDMQFDGNIAIGPYAFLGTKMTYAQIEGNVSIEEMALGYDQDEKRKGTFYIGGSVRTPQIASYERKFFVPYRYMSTIQTYDSLVKGFAPYILNATYYACEKGSCAGVTMAEIMAYSRKQDLFRYLPEGYGYGENEKKLFDIPATNKRIVEEGYDAFINIIDNFQMINKKGALRISATVTQLAEYSKLTKHGRFPVSFLTVLDHSHVVACLGVQSYIDTNHGVKWKDSFGREYDYRYIVIDSGYQYKWQNGQLLAHGADRVTWNDKKGIYNVWVPIEDTFMYVDSSNGLYYMQRWDHYDNLIEKTAADIVDENIRNGVDMRNSIDRNRFYPYYSIEYTEKDIEEFSKNVISPY